MKNASCHLPISRLITLSALLVLAVSLLDSPLRGQDFTVLHVFDGFAGDAAIPLAKMVWIAGDLYGTTGSGGAYGRGAVFKLNPKTGRVRVLYSFRGGADGWSPRSTVIGDRNHNLYGTTEIGGSSNSGTIFRLDPAGNETVLYTFSGGADGAYPVAGLVSDESGNFYGTTRMGGDANLGVVFKLMATGQFTVLHSFSGPDGGGFSAPLVLDAEGNLYGTTGLGGRFNFGVIFEVDPTGKEVVLYNFTGGLDGDDPQGGLIRDAEGNLYGTTVSGGAQGLGTVFKLDTTGMESALHSFSGRPNDGEEPTAGLLRDDNGHLYGTTSDGGPAGWGTVFELDENGNETVLHNFKWA